MQKQKERQRAGAALVDNGGVVVLRRLVKDPSRQNQTATVPRDLNPGKVLQVWPKQLGVTALPLNEISSSQSSQDTKPFNGTITVSSAGLFVSLRT